MSFLEVKDLSIQFPVAAGTVHAVNGVSFNLEAGRSLGIVGESGSGKSVTSLAIMGLLKDSSARVSGKIMLDGDNLIDFTEEQMREIRSTKLSMVFQDSLAALHPFFQIGKQIAEVYRFKTNCSKDVAKARAIEMLDLVGIPEPQKRFADYPHQFSGGMRQRAMIAMALVCNPKFLIADEPTTALDVTVQAQILELLKKVQKEFGTSIILITHDLGVVSEFVDDVLVMYAGRAVEVGTVNQVISTPQHPYTAGLLASIPDLNSDETNFSFIRGTPPNMLKLAQGCSFAPRCDYQSKVGAQCIESVPELNKVDNAQQVRCFLVESGQRVSR